MDKKHSSRHLKKILLAANDNAVIQAAEDALAGSGYLLSVHSSAREALHAAHSENFSLAIVDDKLAEMDGVSFIHILRAAKTTKEIPAALLVMAGDENTRKDGAGAGVLGFLEKPCDGALLLDFVDGLFESNKVPAAASRDKVMAVEDSPIVNKMYAQIFAKHNFDFKYVSDSTTAMDEIRRFNPGLILMDANMPGIDGYELTRIIKSQRDTENIRIIMVTADTQKKSTLKALEAGVADFLTKPFDEEVLLARMRAHLNSKRLFDDLEKAYEEMKVLKDKLELLSITDGLTGLYNHRHFHDILAEMQKESKRKRSDLSLVIFDIDFFKKFNDTHGHKAGDAVLKSVAATLAGTVGKRGLAARYGGEEFTALLPGADAQAAMAVAEEIRSGVEGLCVEFGGKTLRVTVSLGVCQWDGLATDTKFIEAADKALYKSKADGKNRVTLAPV
ncbi:MAG: diguanylate cyclase [Nitrospinae bacterium]|nr:diguanylate cyclase [Nitrospinota bacterium]